MGNPNLRWFYSAAIVAVGLITLKLTLGDRPLFSLGNDAQDTAQNPLASLPLRPLKPPTQADGVDESNPDPQFQAVVNQYVQRLIQSGHLEERQGVWVQSGNRMLAQHQGKTRLPAASLTKLATTLLALDRWKTDYRFVTRIVATGPIENGVLNGDLLVQGGGDPLFVWESAIELGNQLQQMGLKTVKGRLVVGGVFAMNFERDRAKAAELLRQGLDSSLWDWQASEQYQTLPKGTPQPTLKIQGGVAIDSALNLTGQQTLLEYPSKPLLTVLKKMNMYSNNEMAQMLVDLLGGPQRLTERVVELADVPVEEVQFINGSGLGRENQLSPRANCRILDVLGKQLQPQGLGLRDILPIVPNDAGTLEDRPLPAGLIGKTGTLSDISNLAGAMKVSADPTTSLKDPTAICFVIQNYGGDLDYLYKQQEVVLSALKPKVLSSAPTSTSGN